MPKLLSEYLAVDEAKMAELDILDCIIGIDSHVFVDPCLLSGSEIPEFIHSRAAFEEYFKNIVILIKATKAKGDKAWREAAKRMVFPEIKGVSIGYGVKSDDGNAIGPKLGTRLLSSAFEIVTAGIEDPILFELLGLFEEDFGPDRLSDMTLVILHDEFLAFSARAAKELGVKNLIEVENSLDEKLLVPMGSNGTPIVLVPRSLLRDLPVAQSWDDIENVVRHNEKLRQRVNELIASFWKPGKKPSKKAVKEFFMGDLKRLLLLLEAYRGAQAKPYDFDEDPEGLLEWFWIAQENARANPLPLTLPQNPAMNDVLEVVAKIVDQFKRNIEQNGLDLHLYRESGKPKHERYAQLLFFSTADTYCAANNLDLSREPNAGRGPVDFKIAKDYIEKVVAEIKLSSNPNLVKGLEKQVEIYKAAEGAIGSYYIVIQVTQSDTGIKNLFKRYDELRAGGNSVARLVLVDGRLKPSASKVK